MFDGPEISFFSWQFLCISNHDIEEVFFFAFLMLFNKNGYMDFLLFNGEKMGIYSAWPRERERANIEPPLASTAAAGVTCSGE